MIDILLVDDEWFLMEGVKKVFETVTDFSV